LFPSAITVTHGSFQRPTSALLYEVKFVLSELYRCSSYEYIDEVYRRWKELGFPTGLSAEELAEFIYRSDICCESPAFVLVRARY